mgnify:CR=1 FL=1
MAEPYQAGSGMARPARGSFLSTAFQEGAARQRTQRLPPHFSPRERSGVTVRIFLPRYSAAGPVTLQSLV